MTSILKADTIQDTDGNNIINESGNTITIGASGDTTNIIGTLQNNGAAVGGTNTPYFSVAKNTGQTLNHGASTKLTYQTELEASSSGNFDLTNNKFTATEAGVYCFQFKTTIYDADNNLKRFDIYVYKNDSTYTKNILYDNGGNFREYSMCCTWIQTVAVNDYFEVYGYPETTDSGSVVAAGGTTTLQQTTFSGFKLVE